jgi:hypothetical protein
MITFQSFDGFACVSSFLHLARQENFTTQALALYFRYGDFLLPSRDGLFQSTIFLLFAKSLLNEGEEVLLVVLYRFGWAS